MKAKCVNRKTENFAVETMCMHNPMICVRRFFSQSYQTHCMYDVRPLSSVKSESKHVHLNSLDRPLLQLS